MEKLILQNLTLTVTDQEARRAAGITDDSDEEDILAFTQMLESARKVANPKAIYAIAPIAEKGADYILIENTRIKSAFVRTELEPVDRVVPFVATCGVELEEWSKSYQADPLEQYWADSIKLVYLGKVSAILRKTVKHTYFNDGDISTMNPGSLKEWPLPQQAGLFSLLGTVTEQIGVALTKSFLMQPSKSNSGIFFSGKKHYENCRFCPILDCPSRRARYQP